MRLECGNLEVRAKKMKRECAILLAMTDPHRMARLLGTQWNGREAGGETPPTIRKSAPFKDRVVYDHMFPARSKNGAFESKLQEISDRVDHILDTRRIQSTNEFHAQELQSAHNLVAPLVLEFARDIANAIQDGVLTKRAGDATRGAGIGAGTMGVFQGDLVVGGLIALGGFIAGKGIAWWNERRNATLRTKWEGLLQGLSPLELGAFSAELKTRFPKLWDEADDQFLLE